MHRTLKAFLFTLVSAGFLTALSVEARYTAPSLDLGVDQELAHNSNDKGKKHKKKHKGKKHAGKKHAGKKHKKGAKAKK